MSDFFSAPEMQRRTSLSVRRSLRGFTGQGYDKGRSIAAQASWFTVMNLFFMKWWFPSRLRPPMLRAFGASVGRNVYIRHRVRILWPWKLTIGNDTWIGEDVWLLNLEPITIGSDVCLSQGVSLITGSHNRRSPTFEYDNAPITVGDGAWIAYGSTVLRGVGVGEDATVGAGVLLTRSSSLSILPRT